MLALFFFIGCATAPNPSSHAKAQLEQSIATVVAAVSAKDAGLGTEAAHLQAAFAINFGPLVFTEDEQKMRISGIEPCRASDVPCFGYAFTHHGADDRNIGGWVDNAQMLFTSDVLPPDDKMAGFVALHELRHYEQFAKEMPADPKPRTAGDRWPRERDATEFEVGLERAATNGAFDRVVSDLVARERAHTLEHATFGNVVFPKLDDSAEQIIPNISPIGTDLLDVSVIYAFNVALLTDTSEEARDRLISTLQMGLADPQVHALYNP